MVEEAQASAAPAAASGEAPQKIEVTVAWLKQKVADGSRQPILHFDEQQQYTFDAVKTTFRMVKHSCSYPAPPHKARTRTRARACRSLATPYARWPDRARRAGARLVLVVRRVGRVAPGHDGALSVHQHVRADH